MTHALKTWPKYYQEITSGDKTFELRKFDRPFKVGDTLLLQEFEPRTDGYGYTGNEIKKVITHILYNADELGLMKDYAILSFKDIEPNY